MTCVAIMTRDVVDTTRQPNIGSKIWVPRRLPIVFISDYFLRLFPQDSAIWRCPHGFSRWFPAAEVAVTTRAVAALVDGPSDYHHVGMNYDPSALIFPDYPSHKSAVLLTQFNTNLHCPEALCVEHVAVRRSVKQWSLQRTNRKQSTSLHRLCRGRLYNSARVCAGHGNSCTTAGEGASVHQLAAYNSLGRTGNPRIPSIVNVHVFV